MVGAKGRILGPSGSWSCNSLQADPSKVPSRSLLRLQLSSTQMAPKEKKGKKGSKGGADEAEAVAGELKAKAVVDNGRSCTGVLSSHPESRDCHISSFTLLYHGHQLLVDAELQLNFGRWVGCPRSGGEPLPWHWRCSWRMQWRHGDHVQ